VRAGERADSGETPRTDDFFEPRDDGSSDWEELLEGTLLSAARSYEERKVQYLGLLYASLLFERAISPAYAHSLIRLLERLTYRQLAALAFIANSAREEERVLMPVDQSEGTSRSSPDMVAELGDLGAIGLIGFMQGDGSVAMPANVWGPNQLDAHSLGKISLTQIGADLYRLAELQEIPDEDQNEVAAAVRGKRRSGRDDF
jgi:hypothetical protein